MTIRSICVTLLLALTAAPALAYVGPGVGLSLVSSFFTLLAGVALAVAMVLYYPIRRMLRRRKRQKPDAATPTHPQQE